MDYYILICTELINMATDSKMLFLSVCSVSAYRNLCMRSLVKYTCNGILCCGVCLNVGFKVRTCTEIICRILTGAFFFFPPLMLLFAAVNLIAMPVARCHLNLDHIDWLAPLILIHQRMINYYNYFPRLPFLKTFNFFFKQNLCKCTKIFGCWSSSVSPDLTSLLAMAVRIRGMGVWGVIQAWWGAGAVVVTMNAWWSSRDVAEVRRAWWEPQ